MGWTKAQFISAAFEELGLADHVFDLSPEQIQSALVRLESYVGRLKGISFHWPFSIDPSSSNLNLDTKCPDYAVEAIFLNLAIALAPSYGKTLSQFTIKNAADAYNTMINWSSDLPPVRLMGRQISWAGNKSVGIKNIMIGETSEELKTRDNDLIL